MSGSMERFLASHRFGFGMAGDGRAPVEGRAHLEAQLAQPQLAIMRGQHLTAGDGLVRYTDVKRERLQAALAATARARQQEGGGMQQAQAGGEMQQGQAEGDMQQGQAGGAQPGMQRRPGPHQLILMPEMDARVQQALAGEADFLERLVVFWANHFTISVKGGRLLSIAGPYEREAIRANVAGRFRDMLLAVTRHPAMLQYLDNARSIGPNSRIGRRRDQGINENHAREILELHTLGVDGGYTQADVTNFALALTGWDFVGPRGDQPGAFRFNPNRHEPGPRQVMGKVYAQEGEDQAAAILEDLARHPATARHIARKLAAHFVADTPPPSLVAKLEQSFRRSGGDLGEIARTLVRAEESWTPQLTKLRTPYEFMIAAVRTSGDQPSPRRMNQMLTNLGQGVWQAPSPAGYPDRSEDWLAPDAIKTRTDFAIEFASGYTGDAADLARQVLGPALTDETLTAIRRAESSRQGLAILLMSPEFQRR